MVIEPSTIVIVIAAELVIVGIIGLRAASLSHVPTGFILAAVGHRSNGLLSLRLTLISDRIELIRKRIAILIRIVIFAAFCAILQRRFILVISRRLVLHLTNHVCHTCHLG